MGSLVILGASGFLGRSLISNGFFPMPVKAVARRIPPDADLTQDRVIWHVGDLMIPHALDAVLEADDIVMNLAFMLSAGEEENLCLIDNIVEACHRSRVSRLVHCSTAVVVGAARTSRVDETTSCVPITPYERTKYKIEQHALSAMPRGIDVGILRPTAIVGSGGQNLLKLVRSLRNGNRMINYLRACLFRKRPMHLVPVRDVVAALFHLAVMPMALMGGVYIISADEDPDNNFRNVERLLSEALGLECRKFPLVPLPKQILPMLLRLFGRSETDMHRIYDSRKLRATNFMPVDTVGESIRKLGESMRWNNTKPQDVFHDAG